MKAYHFIINGKPYDVRIDSVRDGKADVTVNGAAYQVDLPEDKAPAAPAEKVPAAPQPKTPAPTASSAPTGAAATVVAPMPGVILEVCVRKGDAVRRGQKVAVLEAMKMENDLLAESDGTVTRVHVRNGDSVADGATIITIG